MTKRTTDRGARTKAEILRTAADIASVDGLDGLSIGRLATTLGLSKSGLFAHFGSKKALQLATIEDARERYVQEVVAPALSAGVGIARLAALCEAFLSYVERAVFPGGCFFASAMAEFDCKPSGPVRDVIADSQRQWMGMLERAASDAVAYGELRTQVEPARLAFDLEGALLTANWYFHMFDDVAYIGLGREAVRDRLITDATTAGRRALSTSTSLSAG
jgi:AcrR family transcriptional regulator